MASMVSVLIRSTTSRHVRSCVATRLTGLISFCVTSFVLETTKLAACFATNGHETRSAHRERQHRERQHRERQHRERQHRERQHRENQIMCMRDLEVLGPLGPTTTTGAGGSGWVRVWLQQRGREIPWVLCLQGSCPHNQYHRGTASFRRGLTLHPAAPQTTNWHHPKH